nr:hypothetical protein CFP56_10142 [Quercus suber]
MGYASTPCSATRFSGEPRRLEKGLLSGNFSRDHRTVEMASRERREKRLPKTALVISRLRGNVTVEMALATAGRYL